MQEDSNAEFVTLAEAMRSGMDPLDYLRHRPGFESNVNREMGNLLVRDDAVKLYQRLTGGSFSQPIVENLDEALRRDWPPVTYRIEHMMVVGHNTNIAATYKAGKTTLLGNRTRSLVDGVPFLDSFDVKQVDGSVVIFNFEVSDNQFVSWLDRIGIKNRHKVVPVNLRGKGLFIQDDDAAEWTINTLKQLECEVWEIDPLSAAIRGNTHAPEVAAEWIDRVERIKAEAGVSDLVLTTHTGHLSGFDSEGRAQNERTSGAARWMGWPDSLWTYTKDSAEKRYLSVDGRDVQCDEFQVVMDPDTLRLSDQGRGTSRTASKNNKTWADLINYVRNNPGCSASDITDTVGRSATKWRKQAVEMGHIEEWTPESTGRGRPSLAYRLTALGEALPI